MVTNILEAFAELPDPRKEHPVKLHKLIDIVVIAVCAVIAKAETWEEIADYGELKEDFLRQFLALPHGIPSHDTFNRVFSRLDPAAWQTCFMKWMRSVSQLSEDKLVSVDGKVLRGSKAKGEGKREEKQAALSLISAWAGENEMVLAQLALEEHANELSLIPELLGLLDLEGASVSIDAAGCHKEVATQIIEQGGDYVLSLKANQGQLFDEVNWLFEYQLSEAVVMDTSETFDVAHGRQEARTCWLMNDLSYLEGAVRNLSDWQKLQAIIVIENQVLRQGKLSTQRRFFLTSHTFSAKQALARVRQHWSIENQQHYPLDLLFREDASRTRKGFAAQNLAALRRLALNLLNLDTQTPISKRRKRFKALLDDRYLLNLLGLSGDT